MNNRKKTAKYLHVSVELNARKQFVNFSSLKSLRQRKTLTIFLLSNSPSSKKIIAKKNRPDNYKVPYKYMKTTIEYRTRDSQFADKNREHSPAGASMGAEGAIGFVGPPRHIFL